MIQKDDTINRQAAIEELYKMLHDCFWADDEELDAVITTLNELPPAQSEIIQCKDCKNWDITWENDWAKNYHYCPLIDRIRCGDWFCADAERRTNETD